MLFTSHGTIAEIDFNTKELKLGRAYKFIKPIGKKQKGSAVEGWSIGTITHFVMFIMISQLGKTPGKNC